MGPPEMVVLLFYGLGVVGDGIRRLSDEAGIISYGQRDTCLGVCQG